MLFLVFLKRLNPEQQRPPVQRSKRPLEKRIVAFVSAFAARCTSSYSQETFYFTSSQSADAGRLVVTTRLVGETVVVESKEDKVELDRSSMQ